MAAEKKVAKKKTARRTAVKRELIDTNKFYVRRIGRKRNGDVGRA